MKTKFSAYIDSDIAERYRKFIEDHSFHPAKVLEKILTNFLDEWSGKPVGLTGFTTAKKSKKLN